jgi:hypothetical protein
MASSQSVDGPTCSPEGGFSCLISRADQWVTTHSPWPAMLDPPHISMPSPPMRPASYEAAANTPLIQQSQVDHVYVRVDGQQKPVAAPYAGPNLVVFKMAKTFTIQVGQRQEII